jgi:hypothetical protein
MWRLSRSGVLIPSAVIAVRLRDAARRLNTILMQAVVVKGRLGVSELSRDGGGVSEYRREYSDMVAGRW